MQHVTKARGYALHTRSRGNEERPEDSMDLSTPLGIDCTISLRSIPLTSTWFSQCSSPFLTFDVHPKLIFQTRSWHLVPTRKVSVHGASPIGICKTDVLREPITIFRTRVRSTLCALEFLLSVRLKVNLHDVLNLPSIDSSRCS